MSTNSVDASLYEKKLRELQELTGKSWPAILRAEGRLMAVGLARSTQPFTGSGGWEESHEQGKGAVARDIRKVFASGGDVFDAINDKGNEGLADAFFYFYQTGKIGGKRGAQSLMDASQTAFVGLKITALDPSHHQAARGRKGRVNGRTKRFKQVAKNDGQLDRYIAARQKLVGFAKSAWATCARSLGGVRGLPGWVTRQKAPGDVIDNSKNTTFPFIELVSRVRYADEALNSKMESQAFSLGQKRLTEAVNIALTKAAQKAQLAA